MIGNRILERSYRLALICVLGVLCCALFTSGCKGELDPERPDGAYDLFRLALFEGDAKSIWDRSDARTHDYFRQRYEQLVTMGELIERYLPQTDHRLARRQSGVELTDEVKDGQALFLKIFEPAKLPQDEAVRFGSEVYEIQMSEDGNSAVIVTRSEQQFLMAKAKNGQWHVVLIESGDVIAASFKWLDDNEKALEQTVEDLIAEERSKREAIIAELMKLK